MIPSAHHFHTLARWTAIASVMLAGIAQAATLTPQDTVGLQPALQVTLDSAAAGLAFSNGTPNPFLPVPLSATGPSGLVNALNLSSATVSPTGSSTVSATETMLPGSTPSSVRHTLTWLPSVHSVEVDPVTGHLLSARLDGGFRFSAPKTARIQEGGTVAVDNLRIDFVRSAITADVVIAEATEWEDRSGGTVIFKFSRSSGITSLNLDAAQEALRTGETAALGAQGWSVLPNDSAGLDALAMTGWLELGEAHVTDDFRGMLLDGFSTYYGSPAFAQIAALGYQEGGTLRMGMSVRVAASGTGQSPWSVAPALLDTTQMQSPVPQRLAIPEPGTAALFGAGLMGLAVVASRRQHASGSPDTRPAPHA